MRGASTKSGYLGGCLAVIGVCLALLATSAASAATVEVHEELGTFNHAEMRFAAGPGEASNATLKVSGGDADHLQVELRDTLATVQPGPGCSGGGAPNVVVVCTLHRPHAPEYTYCGRSCALLVAGTAWTVSLTATLSDAGSRFDASSLPGGDQEAIAMKVTSGAGDDFIATAEGNDEVDPGRGTDEVRTGGGADRVLATNTPDGPDLYDLGGYGILDYSQRTAPVLYRADTAANDGAPGEGDTALGSTAVLTGSGDDVLIGGEGKDHFISGDGDDQLSGGGGSDDLSGEAGDNRLDGGDGNDTIAVERLSPPLASTSLAGANRADGGAGDDYVYLAAGSDEAIGGPGDDVIKLGAGDDVVGGGPGDDRIYGNEGDDLIAGEDGDDQLTGDEGSDRLLGGAGKDQIISSVAERAFPPSLSKARGPIDGWLDTVDCGPDADVASVNPWDEVDDCERTILVRAVDFRPLRVDRQTGAISLPVVLSSPGRLTLRGRRVQPQTLEVVESPYGRPFPLSTRKVISLPIRLRPSARRALRRQGRLTLSVRLRFRPEGGLARGRTVKLHLVRLSLAA